MEDYPTTQMEFEDRFNTEAACLDYLERLRWPERYHCPQCGHTEFWRTQRRLYHCRRCRHQSSVLAGTIFQDTKKPLRLWFRAMWQITTQKYGANALGVKRVLGLGSYRTAWTWLHKLRHAMVRPDRDRLTGIIEMDETYIGGEKPGKRGRGAEGKVLVAIAAQADGSAIGRIRLKRIPDASAKSLEAAAKDMIEPGSMVQTDGWDGYRGVSELGYMREIIRNESAVGDNTLPRAHRIAALLKRWLLGTYQGAVRASHIDYYLDEFTFRFNRRTSRSRGKLFYRLVQQSLAIQPYLVKQIGGQQQ